MNELSQRLNLHEWIILCGVIACFSRLMLTLTLMLMLMLIFMLTPHTQAHTQAHAHLLLLPLLMVPLRGWCSKGILGPW